MDISKFLYFANSDTCNPDFLLSRGTIRRFVTWLEEGGIRPSGILSKLRHIEMAITCFGHQHEDRDTEVEFCKKRDMVMSLLSSIRSSLDKEKRKVQVTKLDEFTHHIPELGKISQFISSRRVQNFLDEVCANFNEMYVLHIHISGRAIGLPQQFSVPHATLYPKQSSALRPQHHRYTDQDSPHNIQHTYCNA